MVVCSKLDRSGKETRLLETLFNLQCVEAIKKKIKLKDFVKKKKNTVDFVLNLENVLVHSTYKMAVGSIYIFGPPWANITKHNISGMILYSSQWEIKVVVQSHTGKHNQKLNCT